MFRPITLEQCTVRLRAEQYDVSVRGYFTSDDPIADRDMENSIIRRLDRGDVWAWAYVTVTVSFDGISESEHLGACSYENEKDFRTGDYFEDMCKEALAALNTRLEKIYNAVHDGQGRDV